MLWANENCINISESCLPPEGLHLFVSPKMTRFSQLYLAPTDLGQDSKRARVPLAALLHGIVPYNDRHSLPRFIEQRLGVLQRRSRLPPTSLA
jgi:hypothetical protein